MAAPADVKRELELIENAEWRILSASSDEEKLQRLLKVYLAPLLLKAGSEHASVRNKVPRTDPSQPIHAAPNLTLQAGYIDVPDH